MIIYSVTVSVDKDIEAEWLHWMKTVHVPDVMKTGFFGACHMNRLLDPKPEPGMATYNFQYWCQNMEVYEKYQEEAAPALQKDHTERYKDKFVAFRTILEREEYYRLG